MNGKFFELLFLSTIRRMVSKDEVPMGRKGLCKRTKSGVKQNKGTELLIMNY